MITGSAPLILMSGKGFQPLGDVHIRERRIHLCRHHDEAFHHDIFNGGNKVCAEVDIKQSRKIGLHHSIGIDKNDLLIFTEKLRNKQASIG